MSLIYNGSTISPANHVYLNGNEQSKVYFNGTSSVHVRKIWLE